MKVRFSQLVSHKDGLYALDDRGCIWLRDGLKWNQIDMPEAKSNSYDSWEEKFLYERDLTKING